MELINLIEKRQPLRGNMSIERFKLALKTFESPLNPSRTMLYDIYDETLLDGQVEACWRKRVDTITNRQLTVVEDGNENVELSKLLNCPDMRHLLECLLDTVLWGYTLIQVNDMRLDPLTRAYVIEFDLIPRRNVHPERGFECVSKQAYGVQRDFLYLKPPLSKYMIHAGKPDDMGLLAKVVPYVIFMRGAFGDWAQFSEMFGMPFREAIYNAYDEDTRRKLESYLNRWGAASYLVHQNDVEIRLHDTGGSSQSADVYDKLVKSCEAMISKVILGNTLTTEQGDSGARALGTVHQDAEIAKNQSDENFILSVLNTGFRSVAQRFGFNFNNAEIWFRSPDKNWSELGVKWNTLNSIADRVPVADNYIYEEFDIPKPENYDELKEEMKARKAAGFAPLSANLAASDSSHIQPDGDAGHDPTTFLDAIAEYPAPCPCCNVEMSENTEKHAKNTWLNRLADFFGFGARRRRNSPHKIAYLSAKKLYAQVLEQAKAGQGINALLLEQYSKNLRKAVAGVMDSANFGDQYFALQQQFQANVSQFAAHKAWCAAQQIEAARFDKDGNPRSDEAWQRQATAILDRFDAYQNAEFNTATARARTAKQWTDFNEKENKILFPNLRWLPSRSADPRPEHAKFYGLTLPKDHPFWRTNQPGNLYNCKCDWEETFDSADSVAPQNDSAAVGLEGNPAETKEIFTRNAAWFKFSQNRENEYEKNILELKNDGFYPKEVRNIPVNVSILHNTGEVAGNLEVLHSYLNGKNDIAKISLLPNISEKNMSMKKDFYPEGQLPRNIKKNADALIEFKNGKQIVADFKAMQGNGVNLRRRLKDSYEQADRAIIKIKGTPDVREITETADSFMNQHFRFKELLIYDSRETLIYERKKDI